MQKLGRIDSVEYLATGSRSETLRSCRIAFCARRTSVVVVVVVAVADDIVVVGRFVAVALVVVAADDDAAAAAAIETFAALVASQSLNFPARNPAPVPPSSPTRTSLDIQTLDSSLLPLNPHDSSQNTLSPRRSASTRKSTKRSPLKMSTTPSSARSSPPFACAVSSSTSSNAPRL